MEGDTVGNILGGVDVKLVRKWTLFEHVRYMNKLAFVRKVNDVGAEPVEEDRSKATRGAWMTSTQQSICNACVERSLNQKAMFNLQSVRVTVATVHHLGDRGISEQAAEATTR
jgi:hypothetical protein